jgi:hypothetical protein
MTLRWIHSLALGSVLWFYVANPEFSVHSQRRTGER